jgi:UDP-2,3-diacylglucosamine pyrophosphatase LpxH
MTVNRSYIYVKATNQEIHGVPDLEALTFCIIGRNSFEYEQVTGSTMVVLHGDNFEQKLCEINIPGYRNRPLT